MVGYFMNRLRIKGIEGEEYILEDLITGSDGRAT
jgi:hypothetical protein